MNFDWYLNVSNFTWLDRLKLAGFYLNTKNRWSQDKFVKEYELKMAEFVGCKYAVFVSSGSTANTVVAMLVKDTIKSSKKNTVVFASTSWITNNSPFIREGFAPKFIDVSRQDLAMDLDLLEKYLTKYSDKVALVFVTSLLGFSPNIEKLKHIEKKFNVKVMLDNCESALTDYKGQNISSYFTSTISTYFGHHLCSGSAEGGFIFTNDSNEYDYFLMARNHGMTRGLTNANSLKKYQNNDVDPLFDFAFLGNNFRNTEIAAFGGLLDFKKVDYYIKRRKSLYELFWCNLDDSKYHLPKFKSEDVAFSLPVITKGNCQYSRCEIAKNECKLRKIELRPIISGNLLRQSALIKYGDYKDFPESEHLHKGGFYLGLHPQIREEQILELTSALNKL